MKKKINIIGAGVSGLSIGCYLQMNGFETEIFEKHSSFGGLCTSWRRGDYTFDGCIHWLLGSGDGNPFYKLWSELLDMKSIEFKNHEVRIDIELLNHQDKYGDKIFHLFTNLNKLENYLIDLAPEDFAIIKGLINMMREIQKYDVPPIFDDKSFFDFLKNRIKLMKLIPFLFLFLKWKRITNYKFAERLKNSFLKEVFQLLFDGEELNLLFITMPLAYFDRNSAGYPIGGSYNFVKKIEEKYISLGGKINYNNGVKKIIIENDVARGFLLNDDTKVYSDISVSAADWYYTMFEALDGRYADKTMLELKEQKSLNVFYSIFLVSLGINHKFDNSPHFFRFPLTRDLVSPDGTIYSRLEVHVYNYDPTLASQGKTVVSISLNTRNSDYWIDLRKSDKELYNKNKQDFTRQIIEIIEKKLGNIKENIEVTDIATPATYYRYTNSWKGSTQGWLPPKNLLKKSPVNTEIQGLKNFYYSSHWSVPGGGLPIAIKTARDTVKLICKRYKMKFSVLK